MNVVTWCGNLNCCSSNKLVKVSPINSLFKHIGANTTSLVFPIKNEAKLTKIIVF